MTIKIIVITEHYSGDTSCTSVYDYNQLPPNVKQKVDEAIANIETPDSLELPVYDDGIQHLYSINHPEVPIGTIGEYMGCVTFWNED